MDHETEGGNSGHVSGRQPVLHDEQIKLQVGERHFETTASTLRESAYFKALLSEEWRHDARADGSFYLDADGDLFEHILRYLRRLTLPIFYDNVKGHDEMLYQALLQEAKFYGIDRLRKWLEEKTYLKAVKVTVSTDFCDREAKNKPSCDTFEPRPGVEVQYYPYMTEYAFWGVGKIIKTTTIDHELCLGGWDE